MPGAPGDKAFLGLIGRATKRNKEKRHGLRGWGGGAFALPVAAKKKQHPQYPRGEKEDASANRRGRKKDGGTVSTVDNVDGAGEHRGGVPLVPQPCNRVNTGASDTPNRVLGKCVGGVDGTHPDKAVRHCHEPQRCEPVGRDGNRDGSNMGMHHYGAGNNKVTCHRGGSYGVEHSTRLASQRRYCEPGVTPLPGEKVQPVWGVHSAQHDTACTSRGGDDDGVASDKHDILDRPNELRCVDAARAVTGGLDGFTSCEPAGGIVPAKGGERGALQRNATGACAAPTGKHAASNPGSSPPGSEVALDETTHRIIETYMWLRELQRVLARRLATYTNTKKVWCALLRHVRFLKELKVDNVASAPQPAICDAADIAFSAAQASTTSNLQCREMIASRLQLQLKKRVAFVASLPVPTQPGHYANASLRIPTMAVALPEVIFQVKYGLKRLKRVFGIVDAVNVELVYPSLNKTTTFSTAHTIQGVQGVHGVQETQREHHVLITSTEATMAEIQIGLVLQLAAWTRLSPIPTETIDDSMRVFGRVLSHLQPSQLYHVIPSCGAQRRVFDAFAFWSGKTDNIQFRLPALTECPHEGNDADRVRKALQTLRESFPQEGDTEPVGQVAALDAAVKAFSKLKMVWPVFCYFSRNTTNATVDPSCKASVLLHATTLGYAALQPIKRELLSLQTARNTNPFVSRLEYGLAERAIGIANGVDIAPSSQPRACSTFSFVVLFQRSKAACLIQRTWRQYRSHRGTRPLWHSISNIDNIDNTNNNDKIGKRSNPHASSREFDMPPQPAIYINLAGMGPAGLTSPTSPTSPRYSPTPPSISDSDYNLYEGLIDRYHDNSPVVATGLASRLSEETTTEELMNRFLIYWDALPPGSPMTPETVLWDMRLPPMDTERLRRSGIFRACQPRKMQNRGFVPVTIQPKRQRVGVHSPRNTTKRQQHQQQQQQQSLTGSDFLSSLMQNVAKTHR